MMTFFPSLVIDNVSVAFLTSLEAVAAVVVALGMAAALEGGLMSGIW